MTMQEAFDAIVLHLKKQGRATDYAGGPCRYRTEDGRRCAIGFLIPDDFYRREMEGIPARVIARWDLGDALNYPVDFLNDMQRFHDTKAFWNTAGCFSGSGIAQLTLIARRHNLDDRVLDQ